MIGIDRYGKEQNIFPETASQPFLNLEARLAVSIGQLSGNPVNITLMTTTLSFIRSEYSRCDTPFWSTKTVSVKYSYARWLN